MDTKATLTISSTSQGLAFLALIGFVTSFIGARAFTTINPDVVVVSSGIHFHHFWYGLIMVVAAGWLGIASTRPELDRVYALIFGLGLGLIGDETGLLLTLGDYNSELTFVVVFVGLSFAGMAYLAFKHAPKIKAEVVTLGRGERTVHLGMAVVALSFLPLAFDYLLTGATMLAAGAALALMGVWLQGKHASPAVQTATQ